MSPRTMHIVWTTNRAGVESIFSKGNYWGLYLPHIILDRWPPIDEPSKAYRASMPTTGGHCLGQFSPQVGSSCRNLCGSQVDLYLEVGPIKKHVQVLETHPIKLKSNDHVKHYKTYQNSQGRPKTVFGTSWTSLDILPPNHTKINMISLTINNHIRT